MEKIHLQWKEKLELLVITHKFTNNRKNLQSFMKILLFQDGKKIYIVNFQFLFK